MKEERLKMFLEADFRSEEGRSKIQEILHKIKPLAKYEGDVPLERIEKVISVLSRKYDVGVKYIHLVAMPDNIDIYQADLYDFGREEELGAVYGCCIYELYAKIAIKLYAKTRKMVGK